ncbi:MBL fold metallo-hydrolase [Terriglobus sp. TAA 43]|uniref:MBL fold metallo-hydrolase n=1 Tax=Terriglobus sp. TAA 43 TaxID=278961 RepID=UPI0006917B42|nr:MBL fold metallo-hydrolase [Terriglobus sp. TAA 43]
MAFLKPAETKDGIYLNPIPTEVGAMKHLPQMLRRLLTGKEERVPRKPLGPFRTDVYTFDRPSVSGLRVTWLGHSSLLMEIDGTTVLTDPVFSLRTSMVQWFGPKRFFAPPLTIAELPKLDAVLLTHDHYDHLDKSAVLQLQERTPLFVCSIGVGGLLRKWGIPDHKIHEMQWMDSFTVPSRSKTPLTLTALPARHFSGRGLKRFETLWSSFVLKTEHHNLYHGADSGYWPGYREIGETYGPFDLATLEIGAFDPLWDQIHLGPDNAVKAAVDLRAKVLMPIHWGLFSLAFHSWYQPPERVTKLAAEAGLPLWMPEPGAPTEFAGEARNSLWWRRYCSAVPSAHEHADEAASNVAIRV